MKQLHYQVQGMSCDGCVRALRQALERVPGVEVQTVQVGSAAVRLDPAKSSEADVSAAIQRAGFTPRAAV